MDNNQRSLKHSLKKRKMTALAIGAAFMACAACFIARNTDRLETLGEENV